MNNNGPPPVYFLLQFLPVSYQINPAFQRDRLSFFAPVGLSKALSGLCCVLCDGFIVLLAKHQQTNKRTTHFCTDSIKIMLKETVLC